VDDLLVFPRRRLSQLPTIVQPNQRLRGRKNRGHGTHPRVQSNCTPYWGG
jgi:hypothetical protein